MDQAEFNASMTSTSALLDFHHIGFYEGVKHSSQLCPISPEIGTDELQTKPHKSYQMDFLCSKPFVRYSHEIIKSPSECGVTSQQCFAVSLSAL